MLYIQKGLSPEKALQALVQELAYQKYFNPSLSPELQKLEVLSMSYVMLRQVGLETELNKIGNNINQVAKHVNQSHEVDVMDFYILEEEMKNMRKQIITEFNKKINELEEN